MENSRLTVINGLIISELYFDSSGYYIVFKGGVVLSICNKCRLIGFQLNEAIQLIGKSVYEVQENSDFSEIYFSNQWVMAVDMRDVDFTGPEAMTLIVPGEAITVWS